MENFVFEYLTKVYFGKGAAKTYLSAELRKYGEAVMLCYGGGSIKRNGIYDELCSLLKAAGKRIIDFGGIMPNPTYAKVKEGAAIAKENNINLILAVGGGSVIDCAKIIALQAKFAGDVWEEEIIKCKIPQVVPIPVGAVVTVSGTGSEQNGGCVITNEAAKTKTGLLSLPPHFAVLDPVYTLSVSLPQVMSGAFDTLSHAMETYFGYPDGDNVSDDLDEAVMKSVIRNMLRLVTAPDDYTARSNLMWDSALAENGLLKLGKRTDFQAHMIEHQFGAYTNCNHGMGLAVIQPVYYRHIVKEGLPKFLRFAKNVWNVDGNNKTEQEIAFEGLDKLENFIKECKLPTSLAELDMNGDKSVLLSDRTLEEIACSTVIQPNSYKRLTSEDIYNILKECRG